MVLSRLNEHKAALMPYSDLSEKRPVSVRQAASKVRGFFSVKNSLLYFCLVGWLVCCVLKESTVDYYFDVGLDLLQIACIAGMLLNEINKNATYRRFDFIFLLVIAVFAITALVSKSLTLLQATIIIYLARDSNYRILFKLSFITLSVALLAVCSLSFLGVIDPGILIEDADRTRASMGFQWPSRVGNYVLAILLFYVLWKQKDASPFVLVLILAISALVYFITAARNPFMLTLAMVAAVLFLQVFSRSITTGKLCMALFIGIALVIVWYCCLSVFYNPASALEYDLNRAFSNRLLFARNAFRYNGFTALGCELLASGDTDPYVQGYLDSSYLRIIGYYGVIVAGVVLIALCFITKRVVETKNRYLVLCLALILVHGILEGQLYALQFSPLFFLIPCLLGENRRTDNLQALLQE